jgi:GR25 family glycosyltransferase involved in LPS biosynthesis
MSKRKLSRKLWFCIGILAWPAYSLFRLLMPVKSFSFERYFNHVYVINLERSFDRRKHIEEEFSRVGIKEYEFFTATDQHDPLLDELIAKDRLHQFPPCWACGNNRCHCKSNHLRRPQLANHLSMRGVWEDIVKNNHGLSLICEDDIQFIPQAHRVLAKLLPKLPLKTDQPLLIRMSSAARKDFFNQPIHMDQYKLQSNPCYAINTAMAKLLVEESVKISMPSDVFVHRYCVNKHPEVHHVTLRPLPAHDLSSSGRKQFTSEVLPQGIDEADAKAQQQIVRRIEYVEQLLLTPPGISIKNDDVDTLISWRFGFEKSNAHYFVETKQLSMHPLVALENMKLDEEDLSFLRSYIQLPAEENPLCVAASIYVQWRKRIQLIPVMEASIENAEGKLNLAFLKTQLDDKTYQAIEGYC